MAGASMNGGISLKDPSAILAVMLIIGMVLGPWIMHERTLSRMEYMIQDLNGRSRLKSAGRREQSDLG